MIYNEDAYYTGYYRTVRELGAVPALVFNTIAGLLRSTDGIGEINNETLCDFVGITVQYLRPILKRLIADGYIEKQNGVGRGNKSIYYLTEKGKQNTPFYEQKRETNRIIKGKQIVSKRETKPTPLNTELNKELNKNLSSFEVQRPSNDERDEDKKFIEEEINKSELENKAIDDVKKLFADSEKEISPEIKKSFMEFWRLFAPDDNQKCKYKIALLEWNGMENDWRDACLHLLSRGAKPSERNPYFFLQHFSPVRFFMNQREQYDAYKSGLQLCLVRYDGKQRVMSALMASVFKMEILDEHFEKRFEMK